MDRGPNGSGSALPAYQVVDLSSDFGGLNDAWARYMRERFFKRPEFFSRLNPTEKELVRKEVRRIRWFRDHFKDYRIASSDRLPLVALLEDARTKWREIACRRSPDELANVQKDIDRNGETVVRSRNRLILQMVQYWAKREEYARRQASVMPESFMGDLEAREVNNAATTEDDPKKPNYGYNGWLIVWDQDKGGVSSQHPLIHGKFPHQKISIQQLLYNKEETPLKRTSEKKQLRYFHLPANSMKWVEVSQILRMSCRDTTNTVHRMPWRGTMAKTDCSLTASRPWSIRSHMLSVFSATSSGEASNEVAQICPHTPDRWVLGALSFHLLHGTRERRPGTVRSLARI